MNEISTIIRARLDEGRAIADEDVRQLLAERDALQARVTELEGVLLEAPDDAGYDLNNGRGGQFFCACKASSRLGTEA